MGKIMLPYVDVININGREYHYYRREKRRFRLPNDPTTLLYTQEYNRIDALFSDRELSAYIVGGIASMIEAYKQSTNFKQLKPRTKQLYISVLDPFVKKFGHAPVVEVTKGFLLQWRDKMANTPAKANNSIIAIRSVYKFAEERGIASQNPAIGIKKLKVGEWRPWTEEEIEKFNASAPEYLKLGLDLALYTGQRQGDVLTMHWNHLVDGGISAIQEKTGKRLWISLHSKLRERLENTPKSSVIILTTPAGQPFKKRNFSEHFKEACRAAGLPEDCVFHGLRTSACVRLAEAGCSNKEIEAITGQSLKMIEHYTKMANSKLLSKSAIEKLERFSTGV